ncbi:MAG: hypothetical protein ACK5Z2_07385 [Bacteroidota bacterium]
MKVICYKRVSVELLGDSGIIFTLNSDLSSSNITQIPVKFKYNWPILRFVNGFKFDLFTISSEFISELLVKFSNVNEEELLQRVLGTLFIGNDPITDFINSYNNQYPNTPIINSASFSFENQINLIVTHIVNVDQDFYLVFFQLVFERLSANNKLDEILKLFQQWAGNFSLDDLTKLLIPKFNIEIGSVTPSITFPTSILRQVNINNQPLIDSNGDDIASILKFNAASIQYDSEGGFEVENAQNLNLSFTRSEILRSGFIIEINDAKFDFSRNKNISEAINDDRPTDFIGVYITDAEIAFPLSWNHNSTSSTGKITCNNLLVGTGGISGKLQLAAVNPNSTAAPLVDIRFGQNFSASIYAFGLEFQQNSIINSDIRGLLNIPGFLDDNNNPVKLDFDLHLSTGGDFTLTVQSLLQPVTWKIPDILKIKVSSAALGKKSGRFFLAISGAIDFIANIPALGDVLPKGIEVKRLIIWEDGSIEIEGGNIILPNAVTLKIGPVKLSITALSMGSYEKGIRKYRYYRFRRRCKYFARRC